MKAPTWDFEDMAALPSHCCSIQTCNVLNFTLPSSSAWYLTLRHASKSSLWGWATLHYLKASSKHLCPPTLNWRAHKPSASAAPWGPWVVWGHSPMYSAVSCDPTRWGGAHKYLPRWKHKTRSRKQWFPLSGCALLAKHEAVCSWRWWLSCRRYEQQLLKTGMELLCKDLGGCVVHLLRLASSLLLLFIGKEHISWNKTMQLL